MKRLKVFPDRGDELRGGHGVGLDALVDKADEILRHCPLAERGEARLLEPIRKLLEVLQAVELGALAQRKRGGTQT